ncbi:uncharacterized protein N7473_009380 [Penicillium subrubescens]|uniref:CFEM domain-containing protein n=1 Tax=Penicillium subrubescens TaxID=1316194 RepID=A0A1Q5TAZ0_9EURO|nr:uncharacterized protein N7473_009380 [Penicillium subrubescens]KAJ5886706.1 hypothetical protein N7473_009380 [Penicillium subrubescens]OKO97373.1 hypothetical protein PENSUB_10167 [Penicillium subrubescens]
MKLTLVWLATACMSIASAASLYDLVSEFPNECALFCTGTSFLTLPCDLNATCWCQTPDFVSDFGCCIAHMCREDISKVKNTFNSWCLTASGQGLPASPSTNCSSYDSNPWGTGTLSSSSSARSSTASQSTNSTPIIPVLTGRVIGGIVAGCLGVVILLCAWVWYRIRLSKKEAGCECPSRSGPRPATPPPPYSAEAPQIIELDHRDRSDRSKDDPTAAPGQIV